MTEQEATDRLEELAGGPDRCFKLMRIYSGCSQNGPQSSLSMHSVPPLDERFRRRAKQDGFNDETINHYLNYIR